MPYITVLTNAVLWQMLKAPPLKSLGLSNFGLQDRPDRGHNICSKICSKKLLLTDIVIIGPTITVQYRRCRTEEIRTGPFSIPRFCPEGALGRWLNYATHRWTFSFCCQVKYTTVSLPLQRLVHIDLLYKAPSAKL